MDIDGRAMKLFANDFPQLLVNCVTSPRLRLSAGKALFLTRIHLPIRGRSCFSDSGDDARLRRFLPVRFQQLLRMLP